MTNADRIRAMTDEELAYEYTRVQANTCENLGRAVGVPFKYTKQDIDWAVTEWFHWLRQEAEG